MGMCLYELDTPVTKTTNAILAFGEKADKKKGIEDRCAQTNCIKCGRCISACPLNLMPTELEKAYDRRDKEALMKPEVVGLLHELRFVFIRLSCKERSLQRKISLQKLS